MVNQVAAQFFLSRMLNDLDRVRLAGAHNSRHEGQVWLHLERPNEVRVRYGLRRFRPSGNSGRILPELRNNFGTIPKLLVMTSLDFSFFTEHAVRDGGEGRN